MVPRPSSPTSLLWAFQLKREHSRINENMTQLNANLGQTLNTLDERTSHVQIDTKRSIQLLENLVTRVNALHDRVHKVECELESHCKLASSIQSGPCISETDHPKLPFLPTSGNLSGNSLTVNSLHSSQTSKLADRPTLNVNVMSRTNSWTLKTDSSDARVLSRRLDAVEALYTNDRLKFQRALTLLEHFNSQNPHTTSQITPPHLSNRTCTNRNLFHPLVKTPQRTPRTTLSSTSAYDRHPINLASPLEERTKRRQYVHSGPNTDLHELSNTLVSSSTSTLSLSSESDVELSNHSPKIKSTRKAHVTFNETPVVTTCVNEKPPSKQLPKQRISSNQNDEVIDSNHCQVNGLKGQHTNRPKGTLICRLSLGKWSSLLTTELNGGNTSALSSSPLPLPTQNQKQPRVSGNVNSQGRKKKRQTTVTMEPTLYPTTLTTTSQQRRANSSKKREPKLTTQVTNTCAPSQKFNGEVSGSNGDAKINFTLIKNGETTSWSNDKAKQSVNVDTTDKGRRITRQTAYKRRLEEMERERQLTERWNENGAYFTRNGKLHDWEPNKIDVAMNHGKKYEQAWQVNGDQCAERNVSKKVRVVSTSDGNGAKACDVTTLDASKSDNTGTAHGDMWSDSEKIVVSSGSEESQRSMESGLAMGWDCESNETCNSVIMISGGRRRRDIEQPDYLKI